MKQSSQKAGNGKSLQTLKKVFRYLGAYRVFFLLSILLSAAFVIISLLIPFWIGDVIDLMIGKDAVHFSEIAPILLRIVILIASGALIQWLLNLINQRMSYDVVHDLRRDAFQKLHRLPVSYFDTHAAGDMLSAVIADAEQLSDGLLLGFTQLFTGIATILGTLLCMLKINWKIALFVVVLTPLSLLLAKFIASSTYHLFKQQSVLRGKQTAFSDEMIAGQRTVRAFAHEDENSETFAKMNRELEICSSKAVFFSSLTNPSTRFINNLVYALVALTGALCMLSSSGAGWLQTAIPLTIGNLSCLLSYANQYMKPFNEITGVITELQNAIACASRLFDLLEEPALLPEAGSADQKFDAKGAVTFDNISFAYVKDRPLIQDISLTVTPGQHVAIVGPTGCGKTTLINLLMRFYDVDAGAILVDQTDIRTLHRHALRKNYGMVLQETWLKSGTIRDNITLGKPAATQEETEQAAKAAHAHSFILQLPNGYDTRIGEDGGQLSQGQKQLICIARILLCLPPILILDEATSSIDTRTEQKIQSAFDRLMYGRTSFIVAHRLSIIQNADKILVMRDGNIIEHGTHTELLAKGGFYAELYNSQFEV